MRHMLGDIIDSLPAWHSRLICIPPGEGHLEADDFHNVKADLKSNF